VLHAVLRRWPTLTWATLLLNLTAASMLTLTLLTWRPDNNPRWVIGSLLAVAVVALVWTVVRGSLVGTRDVVVMLSLAFVSLAGLTWGTGRELAAFSNGTSTPMLAIFAVWFLPLHVARVLSYAGTGLWLVAATQRGDVTLVVPSVSVAVQVVVLTEVLGRLRTRLDRQARTDVLTGALNRRGVEDVVSSHLVRRSRLGTPLAVLVLDVDDLRATNEAGGHAAGDALLRSVVEHVRGRLRSGDALGRVGGDEFLVVLPGVDGAAAEVVARRLADGAPASWSVGVAEARATDDTAALVARADARMYEHKRARRSAGQP
jgi:diguanylate cyclase (GGDEF)-like protein